MSRIQDILARAERDGTAQRTQSTPTLVPPPSSTAPSRAIHGTSALDSATYVPPPSATAPAAAIAVGPAVPTSPTATRTAEPILHPALIAAIDPQSPIAEQYRAIRTRLMLQEEEAPLRALMVTSPGAGEGKSVTAANLALTMAQEFQRTVVLVDADLRGPGVHSLFGIDATPGLAEVLAGEAALEEALVHLPDCRLAVLPAGGTAHFPTELLGSIAMRRTLDLLRTRFDRIIVDLPAVVPLADVGTVAPLADGVVMVIRAGVTQRPALDQALAVLEQDKVVGLVLNDTNSQ